MIIQLSGGDMTGEKIIEVTEIYEELFKELGVITKETGHRTYLKDPEPALEHAYSMLPKIREFVSENRMEKAFRWLGFVQGVLFANGQYCIAELKEHNMPQNSQD